MRPSFLSLLALVPLLGSLACSADAVDPAEGDDTVTEEANLSSAGLAAWNAYVNRTKASAKLQPGCVPVRVAPRAGAPKRGTILLFHGFTACPQQYLDISQTLAASGWEVLLPLNPGHGRMPTSVANGDARDDFSDMPTSASKERYTQFAREMNRIMADAPGERVVGGLSLGGAIAARAVAEAPAKTYARALYMSPFFGVPGAAGWLSKAANVLVPGRDAGWGDGCEEERSTGRAGICDFQVQHLRGAADFAEDTARLRQKLAGTKTQIVGVEADGAADNGATKRVAEGAGAALCLYPKGVPHSFLSRFDNPKAERYWLPTVSAQVTGFLANGSPVPTSGTSTEGGAKCRL